MTEPEPWCFRCDLPLLMCEHRGRAEGGRPVRTVEPDWDNIEELARQAADQEVGPTIEATYDQSCPGCGGRIRAGELITFSEGETAWVCGGCIDETRNGS
jgi:hypothetical protein